MHNLYFCAQINCAAAQWIISCINTDENCASRSYMHSSFISPRGVRSVQLQMPKDKKKSTTDMQ